MQDISYIKKGNSVQNEDCQQINGNYSTKIEAIIKLVLQLKSREADVKILLFSFWSSILKHLKEALTTNSIKCELIYNNSLESKIVDFKVRTHTNIFFSFYRESDFR